MRRFDQLPLIFEARDQLRVRPVVWIIRTRRALCFADRFRKYVAGVRVVREPSTMALLAIAFANFILSRPIANRPIEIDEIRFAHALDDSCGFVLQAESGGHRFRDYPFPKATDVNASVMA